jgi:hypothetical protein
LEKLCPLKQWRWSHLDQGHKGPLVNTKIKTFLIKLASMCIPHIFLIFYYILKNRQISMNEEGLGNYKGKISEKS